ncbi:MAG: hypothetical protein LBI55_04175 [Oscillospiraceae bacterium]|nr:hypothetical protein [Oscillospiraceae bacterium]
MSNIYANNEKIFYLIADKFASELTSFDFKREKFQKNNKNIGEFFIGKNVKYELSYDSSSSVFLLKSCDPESCDDQTILSKWLFDSSTDANKQINAITTDFLESVGVSGPKDSIRKISKNIKKRKKDENFDADPMFLINRIANIFPELKAEIQEEKRAYENFRFVNFTKQNINPKLKNFLKSQPDNGKVKKISEIFDGLYKSGDLDARSIITIVILSSIDDESEKIIREHLGDDLKKAWDATKSIRDKKISPERVKKTYSYIASSLKSQ